MMGAPEEEAMSRYDQGPGVNTSELRSAPNRWQLALAALIFWVVPASEYAPASTLRPAASRGEPIGVREACTSITPEQAAWYGIDSAEWKESDGAISFPHCKILSSIAKSGAVFSSYKLTEFNQHIPTAAISRIACKPKTRVAHLVLIPGSSQDWTGMLGVNGFRLFGGPMTDCLAGTMAEHPSGQVLAGIGDSNTLYEPSNDGWGYVTALRAIAQNTTGMMRTLFFERIGVSEDARLNACAGVSLGALLGFQLMDSWQGVTCDGMMLIASGDGLAGNFFEGIRPVCGGSRTIPFSSQAPDFSCTATAMAGTIGLFDKDFRQQVLQTLDTSGEEAAEALIFAYEPSTRPASVQQTIQRLTPRGDLRRPTIIVHGTGDATVPALLSLLYVERILVRQQQDLARFYLLNDLSHGQTVDFSTAASYRLLRNWMTGEEPHDLVFNVPNVGTITVKNSRDAGLESSPCQYFDFIVGSPVCASSGLFPSHGAAGLHRSRTIHAASAESRAYSTLNRQR
jgi:pimeloyl-ACP methyl ester carboxylesterase